MSSIKCDLALPGLDHGGDKSALCEYFNVPFDDAIDFSASINPLGYPPGLESFLASRLPLIQNYPDIQSKKMILALSRYLQVPRDSILAGNGSMELIDLVLRALRPGSVKVIEPAFSEYRRLALNMGLKIIDQSDSADLIFAGHPGNPKGNLLTRDEFENLLNSCRWLVVDEAFVEFSGEEHSWVPEVFNSPQLIVIRSGTKFFGLPGLRLGYLVAHPKIVSQLQKYQLPWSVNVLAQEAAVYVLEDLEFQKRSREYVEKERGWLIQKLEETGWIKTFPSSANFVLCEIKAKGTSFASDALTLFQLLGRKGIFIRPCHNFSGLGPEFFRVAVRTRKENSRLIEAL